MFFLVVGGGGGVHFAAFQIFQSTGLSLTKDQIIKHNYSFCQLDLKTFIKSNYFLLHNFIYFNSSKDFFCQLSIKENNST